ncbi:MAG: 5-(carboxyamino)imidazole ribonucleotide synthase [Acidimicrobiales bacterium]
MGGRGMTATVGIIGGGQLARMTHQAAIALGVRVVVLDEDPGAPAVEAGAAHVLGRPDRLDDLLALATRCDVVTVDHERTPAALLAALVERGHRVAPGPGAARLGQDKAAARTVLGARGVPVAPWALVGDPGAIARFGADHGWPLVLKAPTGGYDGRGVWVADDLTAASAALARADGPLLVEPRLPFAHELAVMVVRSWSGEVHAYPPVATVQRDGQCHEVLLPAGVPVAVATQARQLAVRIAEAAELVGGHGRRALRGRRRAAAQRARRAPHNSAHLTIEACATSQFENHLRAVLDLPLGATDPIVPAACMRNVLGAPDGSDPFVGLHRALAVPGAHVHRYGKDPRPHRKVGHVTATGADLAEARALAARAADALGPFPAAAA